MIKKSDLMFKDPETGGRIFIHYAPGKMPVGKDAQGRAIKQHIARMKLDKTVDKYFGKMAKEMNKRSILSKIRSDSFEKVALSDALLTRALAGMVDYTGKKTNVDVMSPEFVKKLKNSLTNIPKSGIQSIDRAALRTATSAGLSTRRHVRGLVSGMSDDITKSIGYNLHNVTKSTPVLRRVTKLPGMRRVIAGSVPFAKNMTYKAYISKPVRKLIDNKVSTGHILPKTYAATQRAIHGGKAIKTFSGAAIKKLINALRRVK